MATAIYSFSNHNATSSAQATTASSLLLKCEYISAVCKFKALLRSLDVVAINPFLTNYAKQASTATALFLLKSLFLSKSIPPPGIQELACIVLKNKLVVFKATILQAYKTLCTYQI